VPPLEIWLAIIGLPAACTPLILGIYKERKGAESATVEEETRKTVETLKDLVADLAVENASLKRQLISAGIQPLSSTSPGGHEGQGP
jgi:hypothetical protein